MLRGLVNLSFSVFFIFAAYCNANDADWYLWVPLYAIPSLLALIASTGKYSIHDSHLIWSVTIAESVACIIFTAFTIKSLNTNVSPSGEELRELGGLSFIFAWLGLNCFDNFERKNNRILQFGLLMWLLLSIAVVQLITWSMCFVGDWHKSMDHCEGIFQD